jgi:hypothetical protein
VTVEPHRKASVLWGVVGALTFLVLVQGYELAVGDRVGLLVKTVVTLAVLVAVTTVVHRLRPRLYGNESP